MIHSTNYIIKNYDNKKRNELTESSPSDGGDITYLSFQS